MVHKLDEICNFYFHHHHLSTKNLVCDEKTLAACSELLLKALVRTRTNTNINENNLSFASALVSCYPSLPSTGLSSRHTTQFASSGKNKTFLWFRVAAAVEKERVSGSTFSDRPSSDNRHF